MGLLPTVAAGFSLTATCATRIIRRFWMLVLPADTADFVGRHGHRLMARPTKVGLTQRLPQASA